jgi:hypothetical protein
MGVQTRVGVLVRLVPIAPHAILLLPPGLCLEGGDTVGAVEMATVIPAARMKRIVHIRNDELVHAATMPCSPGGNHGKRRLVESCWQ